MKMRSVVCSEFVKRQTPESGFSHFDGTWEELERLVLSTFLSNQESVRLGYKKGVVLIDLPAHKFFSGIVKLNEDTKLVSEYAPRREGEDPHIRTAAIGEKQQAKYASVVLYHKDVLAENNERSTNADWEIVCIKARVTEKEEPMDPYTMARNFLHMKGGTKGDFSAQDFAESIVYWNNHAMCVGKRSLWQRIKLIFSRVVDRLV